MKALLLASAVLAAAPARALAPQDGSAAFAVAYGAAAYAVVADPGAASERVIVRRLGLDGGVLWEQRYGAGAGETPVGAAVTTWGGVSVAGDEASGCFAAHWGSNGVRKWDDSLRDGTECHVRTVLVDADGDTYVLGTTTVGGVFDATVWRIDKRGVVRWSYRPSGMTSRYAFALTLDAAGDGVTATTARSGPSGWTYENFDIDGSGRRR